MPVVSITLTLPEEVADRMRAAALKPSKILEAAIRETLDGLPPETVGQRLTTIDKALRKIRRELRAAQSSADAALTRLDAIEVLVEDEEASSGDGLGEG